MSSRKPTAAPSQKEEANVVGSVGSPPAAYQDGNGVLEINRDLYAAIADEVHSRELVASFVIPIRSGKAWEVPAGHVCRIVLIEGPQVGDFNVWNRHNPRERFWAARTRQLQSAHLAVHDRLWSTLPYLRPIATVTNDSLADYGVDSDGGRVHDLLGTRCDPYVNQMLTGEGFDYHCHSNLVRAVLPYGLTEADVHDVINVFQITGLNDRDEYFFKACPGSKGDFFEIFAEIDLLCALSACPGGDLSIPLWGPNAGDPLDVCRPLGVEVYRVDDSLLAAWTPPPFAVYEGQHGLHAAEWAQTQSNSS